LGKNPVEWSATIDKARVALSIAGVQQFGWGSGAAQSLGLLNDLRNTLAHHKPFTIEYGPTAGRSEDPLETVLSTQSERALIWSGRNVGFRWADCLGGGCARWAANTALNLQRDFFGALGCGYPASDVMPLERA